MAGKNQEHHGKRQAVPPPEPERLGGGARRVVVLEAERAAVDNRGDEVVEPDLAAAASVDVSGEELPHLWADAEHLARRHVHRGVFAGFQGAVGEELVA